VVVKREATRARTMGGHQEQHARCGRNAVSNAKKKTKKKAEKTEEREECVKRTGAGLGDVVNECR
jgi:hypothetical protein